MDDHRICEMCGSAGCAPDDAPLCPSCRGRLHEGVVLRIVVPTGSEPELRLDDRAVHIASVARLLAQLDDHTLHVQLTGPESESELASGVDSETEVVPVADPTFGPSHPLSTGPLPPLRDPLDEDEAESWAEAVGLLDECLPVDRAECPLEALRLACVAARAGVDAGYSPWPVIADAAGWNEPPADDRDLWTAAVMALASVAVDTMDPKSAVCLDAMEADDWLATVLELVRAGAGAAADIDALVALSARCLDVDSAAVDPVAAAAMAVAFEAVLPVWRATGVVDHDGALTALGAWGLPHALARAWGGSLRT